MLSPHLVRQIAQHADRLAASLVERLRNDPHTPSYRNLSPDELRQHAEQIFLGIGDWLAGRSEQDFLARFGPVGEDRYLERVPIHEMVYAVILTKRLLREHTHQASAASSAVEIHNEKQLDAMIGGFFDQMLYALVKGYEGARARAALARPAVDVPGLGDIKPGQLGWVP